MGGVRLEISIPYRLIGTIRLTEVINFAEPDSVGPRPGRGCLPDKKIRVWKFWLTIGRATSCSSLPGFEAVEPSAQFRDFFAEFP